MKKISVFVLLLCSLGPVAQAKYYVGAIGARFSLDYRNVLVDGVDTHVTGSIELAGVGAGISQVAPGSMGYEFGVGLMGTNSERLTPRPGWENPWYYRLMGKVNYTFPFRLIVQAGGEYMSSFYQDEESHYQGIGVIYGIGYRINDKATVSLTSVNSSVLYASDNFRVLRGQMIEANFTF